MCGGVKYIFKGNPITVYFPNPKAQLPILKKDGETELIPWGRRKEQEGYLPPGGWARLESIESGRWEKYFAKPVKIIVNGFMEKDKDKVSHWFDLSEGQYIQGLLADYNEERRVYVVTITPTDPNAIYNRWPRIMNGG